MGCRLQGCQMSTPSRLNERRSDPFPERSSSSACGLSFCSHNKLNTYHTNTRSTRQTLIGSLGTHWISISGCLMDMLESDGRCVVVLAASSPTRPRGLFKTGRKSSEQTGNKPNTNKSVTNLHHFISSNRLPAGFLSLVALSF